MDLPSPQYWHRFNMKEPLSAAFSSARSSSPNQNQTKAILKCQTIFHCPPATVGYGCRWAWPNPSLFTWLYLVTLLHSSLVLKQPCSGQSGESRKDVSVPYFAFFCCFAHILNYLVLFFCWSRLPNWLTRVEFRDVTLKHTVEPKCKT